MTPIQLRPLEQRLVPHLGAAKRVLAAPKTVRVVRLGCWALVAAGLVWYLAMLWGRMGVYAGGSDSSGYANNAKLILEGHLFAEQRRLEDVAVKLPDYTFVPLGFRPSGATGMVPTYPLGLSALFAVAAAGTSLDTGMALAMWVMAAGSLVVTYWFCREMELGRGWSMLGAGTLAACPLFGYIAEQAMSDMPALLWTTAALLVALMGRRRRWLLAVAGALVAGAVFIRPVNVLVLLPLAWALGADWRRWAWLVAGGFPGGILWAVTNRILFGRYLTTGYVELEGLFQATYVMPTLRNYAETLPWLLPLAVFAPFAFSRSDWPPERRGALGLAVTWALACTGFYAFYRFTHEEWWYLRFILPVFPVVILFAMIGLRRVAKLICGGEGNRSGWRVALAGGLVVLVVCAGLRMQLAATKRWDAFGIGRGERVYPEACQWARTNLPANSVVFAMQMSGALFYSGPNIVVRWDHLDTKLSGALFAAATQAGRPVYAVFYPFEVEETFGRKLPGRWVQIGAVRHVTMWRLEDPAGTMP